MATGSWLIGSYETMPAQTWSVTANAVTEDVTIAAGNYYLEDTTTSRSLCEAAQTALNSHSQVADATVVLGRDRLVHIDCSVALAIDFTDTVARNMLGFQANLLSATGHDASLISRYLWVPDKPESPEEAILGVEGYTVKNVRAGLSGLNGHVVITQNDERVYNNFFWDCLLPDRFWTTNELGGEWHEFWDTVVSQGLRFKLYRNATNDETSETAVNITAGNQLGPYKYRFSGGRTQFDVRRKQPLADANFRVELPVIVVEDY